MPTLRPKTASSALVVVDIQPKFLSPIFEADRVLTKAKFLLEVAKELEVPVLVSEQVPDRMGGPHPELLPLLGGVEPIGKTAFGCCESPEFMAALTALGRKQIVLIGIETHICVSQTALGLLDLGYEVAVCPDAVSARTLEMHKLGMERIRDAGAAPIHVEGVTYEWLESARSLHFRAILEVVKRYA